MTLARRVLFFLEVLAWSVPPALVALVLWFVAALASGSGGDDNPPSSDTSDRVTLILWPVVSLLVGYALARRRAGSK